MEAPRPSANACWASAAATRPSTQGDVERHRAAGQIGEHAAQRGVKPGRIPSRQRGQAEPRHRQQPTHQRSERRKRVERCARGIAEQDDPRAGRGNGEVDVEQRRALRIQDEFDAAVAGGGADVDDEVRSARGDRVAVRPDKTRPVISSLKLSPSKFVAAKRGPSITAARKPAKKRAKKAAAAKKRGTSVSYRISEAATVVFAVQRRTTGRRSGRSCVKATKRLRHHKRCTRYVSIKGSFTRTRATGGTDKLRFTGRLAGHTLDAARYRLGLVATDRSKNRSTAATATFVVKRH